jgi:hypothetical protein
VGVLGSGNWERADDARNNRQETTAGHFIFEYITGVADNPRRGGSGRFLLLLRLGARGRRELFLASSSNRPHQVDVRQAKIFLRADYYEESGFQPELFADLKTTSA